MERESLKDSARRAMYAKIWNDKLSKNNRMERFEKMALSGTHFNEDNEANWMRFNYGDTRFDKLTPKMQDTIVKQFETSRPSHTRIPMMYSKDCDGKMRPHYSKY